MKKARRKPSERMERKDSFNFNDLPVELKHEILKKLKTGFLESVCSEVSPEWSGMVSDILCQRAGKVPRMIPEHLLNQLKSQLSSNCEPLELLKLYERSYLRKNFAVTPILVNGDALSNRKGIVYNIWKERPCECSNIEQCIAQSVHVMNAMDLIIIQGDRTLQIYHLTDFERLNDSARASKIESYQCIDVVNKRNHLRFQHSSTVGISVFQNRIVVEENPRTLLLLEVESCDHATRTAVIRRLRMIHLPLWCQSLCLLNDLVYIIYSTGSIGKWNRTEDELSITDTEVLERGEHLDNPHQTRMFPLSDLIFIKSTRRGPGGFGQNIWYVQDTTKNHMNFVELEKMPQLITQGFLLEEPSWECTEVLYMNLCCNFFTVHFQVQNLITNAIENRLSIRRIKRLPKIDDFLDFVHFKREFIYDMFGSGRKKVTVNASVMTPFLPLSLKPWQLHPPDTQPVPVVDMVAVKLSKTKRENNRPKVRTFRIRIANLPLKN